MSIYRSNVGTGNVVAGEPLSEKAREMLERYARSSDERLLDEALDAMSSEQIDRIAKALDRWRERP